jgi:hypothetical protein
MWRASACPAGGTRRRATQGSHAGFEPDSAAFLGARVGGEEFLVLAAAVPGEGAILAERVRETIERELAPVTVSIGVYETIPGSSDRLPDVHWGAVNIADHALHAAKVENVSSGWTTRIDVRFLRVVPGVVAGAGLSVCEGTSGRR